MEKKTLDNYCTFLLVICILDLPHGLAKILWTCEKIAILHINYLIRYMKTSFTVISCKFHGHIFGRKLRSRAKYPLGGTYHKDVCMWDLREGPYFQTGSLLELCGILLLIVTTGQETHFLIEVPWTLTFLTNDTWGKLPPSRTV